MPEHDSEASIFCAGALLFGRLLRNKMAAEDRRREKKINLAVLRNLDKFAANILDTASSVAHYTFDANTEKWVRRLLPLLRNSCDVCILIYFEVPTKRDGGWE